MCSIDYVSKYCLSNSETLEQIAQSQYVRCEEENVAKVLKKVKEIKIKISEGD